MVPMRVGLAEAEAERLYWHRLVVPGLGAD